MISYDLAYYRPDTAAEAVEAAQRLQSQGKKALFYAGGSEIITMCRAGSIQPDAVIDIKAIAQCKTLYLDSDALHIGAACTLNQISRSGLFPLLALACGRIADHTNQCRITLGGNLCGTILYHEASLPLLLADAQVTLMGPQGERTIPLPRVFNGRLQPHAGELAVQFHVPLWALRARHFHIKKTTNEKIDYPLISIAAICAEDGLRAAFSGICPHPFQSAPIQAVLNDSAKSCAERAQLACKLLPQAALADAEGSGEYRLFVWRNTLKTLLEEWEHGGV